MDQDSSLVREAIRDYETAYGAVQTAAYRTVHLHSLFSQLRMIEDRNWDRELCTTMDELKLAHAYFHFTFKTARNSVDKLLTELQKDLDAIEAEQELVEPEMPDVLEEHNTDLTKAAETTAPEEIDDHNIAAPKETEEKNPDLSDHDPNKNA